MDDLKFSITTQKNIVWSWPSIARDLDDICTNIDGIYPTYNNSGELNSVSIDLSLYLKSRNKNDQDYSDAIYLMRKYLQSADNSDPIDRKNLFELLDWINNNQSDADYLEVLT